ncbi:MAG: hypothetical protein MJB12_09180, partial [Firmicutes bacterium]|nr:hypothetical protein [Bacillota bacterium]
RIQTIFLCYLRTVVMMSISTAGMAVHGLLDPHLRVILVLVQEGLWMLLLNNRVEQAWLYGAMAARCLNTRYGMAPRWAQSYRLQA